MTSTGITPAPDTWKESGSRRTWAIVVVLVIVAGSVILGVLATGRLGTADKSNTAPPNVFSVELAGSFQSAGNYLYNLSFSHLESNITTNWTQFYLCDSYPCAHSTPGFLVKLENATGTMIGLFNSSQSSWSGGGFNQSVPSLGGWTSGYGIVLAPTDILQVAVPTTPTNVLLVGMGFSGGPSAIQQVQL